MRSILDDLADDVRGSVRRAKAGRQQAGLAAQFQAMSNDVDDAANVIAEALEVLESPQLTIDNALSAQLAERRASLKAQLDKLRLAASNDPAGVRQGNAWRVARQTMLALKQEASEARAAAYSAFLATFADGDRQLADSLPPGTPGVEEYRSALKGFEAFAERTPQSSTDVTRAADTGRRLVELRERVEAGAVPEQFRTQWRELRGAGLPLTRLTPEFREWLDERGLSEQTVLRYRGA